VLFFEDLASTDKKSDPLKHVKSPTERMDLKGHLGTRWLRCRPPCSFDVLLPERLPERFTVDFELDGGGANGLTFWPVNTDGSALESPPSAQSSTTTLAFSNGGDDGRSNEIPGLVDASKPVHFSWSFDGAKVKAYVAQQPGLNVPNLQMPRTARLHFEFIGGDDPTLIDQNDVQWLTNLRIAAGGNPVSFEELAKTGRLVLQGILFDTGKDTIRSESIPTLLAVTKMLTEHADLKLGVEGHTDNQGKADANLALSDKRATAVKTWLVAHKIDGARLEPKGFGQTKPVATNDTAEGRQANRRVEVVKK
jgi:outer membrane protein OmpA-like peptidoglycan-associated protein